MLNKKEAFSSLEFLITLFVLLILAIGFSFFITTSHRNIAKRTQSIGEKETIDIVLDEVYKKIKEDNTPESDSRFDPIWDLDDTYIDGYHVSINALSGKINLNYINPNIFTNSGFRSTLNDNSLINSLKNVLDEKLLYTYEDVKEYISKENFDKFFTFYGFANINTIRDTALEMLVNKISNSFFGNEMVNRRKSLFRNKQYFQTETEFNMFCGIYYSEIFPYINIQPQLNVQFIEEEALRWLLESFNVSGSNQKANTLINLRNAQEIKEENLLSILGISKSDEVYYHLGCKTYAWQFTISGRYLSCQIVLYRDITESSMNKPKFYIVEKKWQHIAK